MSRNKTWQNTPDPCVYSPPEQERMAAKPACAPCRAQRRCKTSEGSPLSNSAPLLSEAERAPQYEKPVSAAPEARHNPSRESQAQFRAAAGKHPMDNRLSRPATCREWRAANTLASPQARPAWARADPSRAAGVWRGTPPCPASDGHACSNCAALLIQARAAEKTAHLAMLRNALGCPVRGWQCWRRRVQPLPLPWHARLPRRARASCRGPPFRAQGPATARSRAPRAGHRGQPHTRRAHAPAALLTRGGTPTNPACGHSHARTPTRPQKGQNTPGSRAPQTTAQPVQQPSQETPPTAL